MALHTFVAGEELTAAQLNDSFASRVATTGDETIAGVKTFSSAPKSSIAASASGELVRYDEAVLNTGNQTIAGVKTFSSFPVTPSSDPSSDYEVANKQYVDSNPGAKFDHGVATRATDAGTGTQVISHSLGRVPKLIKITTFGRIGSANTANLLCWGSATGTGDEVYAYFSDNGSENRGNGAGSIIYGRRSDGEVAITAVVSAVSSTSFTLNFTIYQTQSSTIYMKWEVWG